MILPALPAARIGVVGLGYVGLPLAIAFGGRYPTVAFDANARRIAELRAGQDATGEIDPEELAASRNVQFTDCAADLANCNVYVVAVPTPIDAAKRPDLSCLEEASLTVGGLLVAGDVVVFESTVYPGCTEEICVPLLQRTSGLRFNQDFAVGYSPERINPGDKLHRLADIRKVTSGSTPQTADFVDALYAGIVEAGTHKAPSIKVAEAAKIIENTQRDLNIALVNDLAILFDKLGIDTLDVLEAAGTKWNFLPFRPGLVGGHCIGVDPYYLTHKAQEVGHHPQLILAGRRTNDGMGLHVADQVLKLMLRKRINPVGARVLILGLAFKENCPDVRNTRVMDLVDALVGCNIDVDVCDPWVDAGEAERICGITPIVMPQEGSYDAVVLAVAHAEFKALGAQGVRAFGKPEASIVYDVKSILPRGAADGRL